MLELWYLIDFFQICSPFKTYPPYSCAFNTSFAIQANPLASYTLAVALLPSLFEFVNQHVYAVLYDTLMTKTKSLQTVSAFVRFCHSYLSEQVSARDLKFQPYFHISYHNGMQQVLS